MAIFTVHEAKTQLSKLIARAEAGEQIVICRGREPAVRLEVVGAGGGAELRRRALGMLQGQFGDIPDTVWFDLLPDEDTGLSSETDQTLFSKPKP